MKVFKTLVVLLVSTIFITYDVLFLEPFETIREFNVAVEFTMAAMALVLFFSIESLKNRRFYHFLNMGFLLIYVSMLVDGLDQFYYHDELYTGIWEKSMQLIGFALVFFGVKAWIVDHAALNLKLEDHAYKDQLTGLYNRRGMLKKFEVMNVLAEKEHKAMSLIIADLDDFKLINDTYGHIVGDKLLADVGQSLYRMMGKNQIIGRWGGEEFAICMLGYDLNEAHAFAEKVRAAVAAIRVRADKEAGYTTVSLGVSQKTPNETFMSALQRADRSLYLAKQQGKNQTKAH